METLTAAIPYIAILVVGSIAGICRAFGDRRHKGLKASGRIWSGINGGWLGFIAAGLLLREPDRTGPLGFVIAVFCGQFGPLITVQVESWLASSSFRSFLRGVLKGMEDGEPQRDDEQRKDD